jgi:hypothetical protein
MHALYFIIAVACFLELYRRFFFQTMERCSHGSGIDTEVRRLRRGFIERRVGDRRDPERRGSPPPLVERRKGLRRR